MRVCSIALENFGHLHPSRIRQQRATCDHERALLQAFLNVLLTFRHIRVYFLAVIGVFIHLKSLKRRAFWVVKVEKDVDGLIACDTARSRLGISRSVSQTRIAPEGYPLYRESRRSRTRVAGQT